MPLWSVLAICKSHATAQLNNCSLSLFCMKPLAGKVAALQSFTFPTSFGRGLPTARSVYSGTMYILATKAEFVLQELDCQVSGGMPLLCGSGYLWISSAVYLEVSAFHSTDN